MTDVSILRQLHETILQRHIEQKLLFKSTMYGERLVFAVVVGTVDDGTYQYRPGCGRTGNWTAAVIVISMWRMDEKVSRPASQKRGA